MALALTSERLKRYKDIAVFLLKHAREDNLSVGSTDGSPAEDQRVMETGKPEQFTRDLEALGPTFIKLGQLLSTRPDFLSRPYILALSRLQDNVASFPYEEVEKTISSELGVRISKAFLEFDPEPVAAASLGQVHKAKLRDGRQVAVKVQRPGIREVVVEDLAALEDVAVSVEKLTDVGRSYAFQEMLGEFRKTLLQELDYRLEAQNLVKLSNYLKNYERIIVPQPVDDYTTAHVLTMDYVRGTKVTALSPLAHLDMDGAVLAEDLFKAYLDQVLVHGFFHADPHPGNVFVTDDHRIALIDLGMVARIDPEMREHLLKILLSISEGRGQEAADLSLTLGMPLEDFNEVRFRREAADLVSRYQDLTIEQINVGSVMIEISRLAGQNGFRMSSQLTMLGKTLLNLDEIGRTLEPSFDPNQVIRKHANAITQQYVLQSLSPGKIFSSILELNEFLRKLPARLNKFVEILSSNQFRLNMFDEGRMIQSLEKIANRITLGIVLAALIVGAAMMMRVPSSFTLFGYPGIAVVMFLAAAVFGFFLVVTIFMRDEWSKRKR